ncbi:hypothetical protein MKZ38_006572 [Zalerion maritima]|uniref:Uncharacterized protein n=1 Tax=Zalerion maritima TaxID=339359 RepID=A0AAD5WNQ0_9PEZI|nr:hypothetical protein MKZ38_006572 [Zalerion maritima]
METSTGLGRPLIKYSNLSPPPPEGPRLHPQLQPRGQILQMLVPPVVRSVPKHDVPERQRGALVVCFPGRCANRGVSFHLLFHHHRRAISERSALFFPRTDRFWTVSWGSVPNTPPNQRSKVQIFPVNPGS